MPLKKPSWCCSSTPPPTPPGRCECRRQGLVTILGIQITGVVSAERVLRPATTIKTLLSGCQTLAMVGDCFILMGDTAIVPMISTRVTGQGLPYHLLCFLITLKPTRHACPHVGKEKGRNPGSRLGRNHDCPRSNCSVEHRRQPISTDAKRREAMPEAFRNVINRRKGSLRVNSRKSEGYRSALFPRPGNIVKRNHLCLILVVVHAKLTMVVV